MGTLERILLVEDDPKDIFAESVQVVEQVGVFWALINEPPPGTVMTP